MGAVLSWSGYLGAFCVQFSMASASGAIDNADAGAETPIDLHATISNRSGRTRRGGKALEKRKLRPLVEFLTDGIKPITVARYGRETNRFKRMVQSILRGLSLAEPVQSSAWQALSIFTVLFMQVGFDSRLMGVFDGQSFIAGLNRILLAA